MTNEKIVKELKKKYKVELEFNNYFIKTIKDRICICADNSFGIFLSEQKDFKDYSYECWQCIRYMKMNDF